MKRNYIIHFFLFISLFMFLQACNEKSSIEEDPCWFDDCMDLKIIDYAPAWGPDGEWIAYTHKDDSLFENSGIYLIRPDGTDKHFWRQYGDNATWSPDGNWIAFSQNAQIWKMRIKKINILKEIQENRNG
jgi:dipeptidyl aminopeptidase/acylaminoacyl peptidase